MAEDSLSYFSDEDIEKIDYLVEKLRGRVGFAPIATILEEKYGENTNLYRNFGEFLFNHKYTEVTTDSIGNPHIWEQRLTPKGNKITSFKELKIQQEQKVEQERKDKDLERKSKKTDLWYKRFAIIGLSLSGLAHVYEFLKIDSADTRLEQQEAAIDSLRASMAAFQIEYKPTPQQDTVKADTASKALQPPLPKVEETPKQSPPAKQP